MDAKVLELGVGGEDSHIEESCTSPFPLANIRVGKPDKLGHRVLDILWCGTDYAVYRSERGVYVHFSDNPERAQQQRVAFTQIAPELCELRFLTSHLHRNHRRIDRPWSWLGLRPADRELYDHNVAQALMLTMENKLEPAKAIAKAALTMAVRRSTNDNTIRYVRSCMIVAVVWSLFMLLAQGFLTNPLAVNCATASIFGAIGAAFSIITRVDAFEMKPCQQSNMNYWMSGIRIIIGIIGGVMLLLLGRTLANGAILDTRLATPLVSDRWEIAATFGFVGGFSERLVKSLLRRTEDAVVPTAGTPVQEARRMEGIER
jgi:hypothetical protein